MTVYRMPAGALLIAGDDLVVIGYAIGRAQAHRRRNGLPPSRDLDRLGAALAASGQTDSEPDAPGQAETVTTRDAAALLGCSDRTARRLAPLLGGRRIGGVWQLDRAAVTEHRAGCEPEKENHP